jgi:MFS superfamily sulfate permease-like transporter
MTYFPDRFLVIALSGFLTWFLGWDKQGLQVLGRVQTPTTTGIPFHWPLDFRSINVTNLIITAFLIALVGLFESSLTAKSLHKASEGKRVTSLRVDADQELVALGLSNIVAGCFLGLPAFGGYGRSKLNFATGGRTPVSNLLLSGIALVCIWVLLPAFAYLPKGVLGAMVAIVGVSMIEECPHDILFFAQIHAWPELALMGTVLAATLLYSVSLGMALGLAWSLATLAILRAWRAPIRILDSQSSDGLDDPEFSQIANLSSTRTLLISVAGPLTFANTSSLEDRLNFFIDAEPRVHHSHADLESIAEADVALIFDIRHCTGVDGCAIQALTEIIEHYISRESTIVVWEQIQLDGTDQIQHKLALSNPLIPSLERVVFSTCLEEIFNALGIEMPQTLPYETLDV